MRAAVVNALVWRAVAELHVRHGHDVDLRLAQVGSADGAGGQLHLWIGSDAGGSPVRWIVDLGTSGGRWRIQADASAPVTTGDLVDTLLGVERAGLIERLERGLGLRRPAPAPEHPAAHVLAVRTLAEVLARESASRMALGTTLGALGSDSDVLQVAEWAGARVGRSADGQRLRQLVALHDGGGDGRPCLAAAAGSLAVFDLALGSLHLLESGHMVATLDLASTYRLDGRRLARLVERVRDHLGRRPIDGWSPPARVPPSAMAGALRHLPRHADRLPVRDLATASAPALRAC